MLEDEVESLFAEYEELIEQASIDAVPSRRYEQGRKQGYSVIAFPAAGVITTGKPRIV
ncbi:hypothetical protein [Schumannella luteola]